MPIELDSTGHRTRATSEPRRNWSIGMKPQYPFLAGALLGIVFVLLLGCAVLYQFGGAGNALRYLQGYNYVVYPTKVDVGEGTRGQRRTTTVTVRNLSFSPIRVVGAVTTCNCLTPTGLPLTIPPRRAEELTLTIYLDSANGQVEQLATILIDDGQMQRAPVVITGRWNEEQPAH